MWTCWCEHAETCWTRWTCLNMKCRNETWSEKYLPFLQSIACSGCSGLANMPWTSWEHAENMLNMLNMSKHEIVFGTWKKNIWTCSMFKTLKNTEHGETCSERCKTGKKHAAAPWPHFLKSGVKGQQHVSACFAVFSMFSMFEYVQCMFKLLFFVNIGQTWLKQDVNMLKHAEHAEHASTWNAEMKHDQKNICHFCSQLHV